MTRHETTPLGTVVPPPKPPTALEEVKALIAQNYRDQAALFDIVQRYGGDEVNPRDLWRAINDRMWGLSISADAIRRERG